MPDSFAPTLIFRKIWPRKFGNTTQKDFWIHGSKKICSIWTQPYSKLSLFWRKYGEDYLIGKSMTQKPAGNPSPWNLLFNAFPSCAPIFWSESIQTCIIIKLKFYLLMLKKHVIFLSIKNTLKVSRITSKLN